MKLKDYLDLLPMITVIVLVIVLLLVTGCASKPEPAVRVVTQQVFVPKMINCINKDDVPEYSLIVKTKINKNDSEVLKVKKLITREKEHQQYANLVQPLINNCIGK